MSRNAASVAKVICFHCRESTCECVAELNVAAPERPARYPHLGRAFAWLGGACVAGTALGAGLAFLIG